MPHRLVIHDPWRPFFGQARFLADRTRICALIGGFGSGKTATGARKSLLLAAANPGRPGWILAPTHRMLEQVTWPAWVEAVPRELVAKTQRPRRLRMELVNGATIHGVSADPKSKLDGPSLAWFWLDEGRLVSGHQHKTLVTRLGRSRRDGQTQGLITSTGAFGWLYDEFGYEPLPPGRSVHHVSSRENLALDPATLADWERTLDPQMALMGIEGRWAALGGVVYVPPYDPARHVVLYEPQARAETVVGCDFGDRHSAVVFLQPYAPMPGAWVVVDELMADYVSAAELAEQIQAKGYRIRELCIDPASNLDQRAAMRRLGPVYVPPTEAEQEQRLGIGRMRAGLLDVKGRIRLYFSTRLRKIEEPWKRGVLKDIVRYKWPEPDRLSQSRPYLKPLRDGVSEHSMDAIRYPVSRLLPSVEHAAMQSYYVL